MAPLTETRVLLDALARRDHIALIVDLDGTLIPFAATPADGVLAPRIATTLRTLRELGVVVIAVSGRQRADVDPLRSQVPGAWWFAEHGAWRHDDGDGDGDGWSGPERTDDELVRLTDRMAAMVTATPGARLERKTLSCALHWREVAAPERAAFIQAAELAIEEWLESHPHHERLDGVEMVEVRPRECHKGRAVQWVKARWPQAALLALGDDVTDEDMFRALGDDDVAIAAGRPNHPSHARAYVDGVDGVHRLVEWLAEVRGLDASTPPPIHSLDQAHTLAQRTPLLVISNRTPAVPVDPRRREVGGLVAALEPVLVARSGVWLGWSGADGGAEPSLTLGGDSVPRMACFDFPPGWRQRFYDGLCNRALWPLLHSFPGRVRYEEEDWRSYVAANATYARLATEVVAAEGTVWIHDYHLLLTGRELRQRGHTGPIGLFLHVPFPGLDLFETLPWADEVLDGLLAFDLIGVHTRRYADSLLAALRTRAGTRVDGDAVHRQGQTTHVVVAPIGIEPQPFRHDRDPAPVPEPEIEGLRAALGERKLLLGVDRLDYSKGVPERLAGFERLLERHPRWLRKVSMVQISVPSRADVPEYAELRSAVENLVGRINGRFGDADWVPVRYLYRSYSHAVLAQLYRVADVGVVTPLRDGMNLVAKELVAAQDPAHPAVLVLSKFAGAAETLTGAILTNPYYADGLADDLDRALSMPLAERQARHGPMLATVCAETAHAWADRFLEALRDAHRARPS